MQCGDKKKYTKYFIILCLIHTTIWSLFPYFSRISIPFDTMEGVAWGNQWMLGYNKHPPLAAWLCALFYKMGGSFGVYILAQIAIIITFISVWKLASYYVPPLLALFSVLLLEGNLSLTLVSPNFNPTAILAPLWALLFLSFYLALKRQDKKYWIYMGILVALNILAKYQSIIIFIVMFFFLLSTTKGRKSFKNIGIYIAITIAITLTIPHFIYSYMHKFPEIRYALNSTVGTSRPLDHILMPLKMILNQFGTISLSILIALPFIFAKRDKNIAINKFNMQFLLTMLLGPFILTLLISIITGSRIDNNWFVPYFSLIGLAMIVISKPILTKLNVTIVVSLLFIVFFSISFGRYGAMLLTPHYTGKVHSKSYFPSREISSKVTKIWHERYKTQLSYVAGDHYLVAYVSSLSDDKPKPFMDWDISQSPWINQSEFLKKGAIFIWYAKNKYNVMFGQNSDYMPLKIIKKYPRAIFLGIHNFSIPFLIKGNYEPVRIGIAILPPEKSVYK